MTVFLFYFMNYHTDIYLFFFFFLPLSQCYTSAYAVEYF